LKDPNFKEILKEDYKQILDEFDTSRLFALEWLDI
jgi:hypothetical protein